MKKITGYVSVRPLGSYDFEFYVDDNTTDEEIQRMIDDELEFSQGYEVEEGYIKEQTVTYRKKYDLE